MLGRWLGDCWGYGWRMAGRYLADCCVMFGGRLEDAWAMLVRDKVTGPDSDEDDVDMDAFHIQLRAKPPTKQIKQKRRGGKR